MALPELNGLGVITSTPLLTRLAQLVMCLGFPLRTTNETMELVTMPLVGVALQVGETMPAFTSLVMSGASEKLTTSAGRPSTTAVAWEPEAPKDWEKVTALPGRGGVERLDEGGIGRLRRGVGHQGHRAGGRVAAPAVAGTAAPRARVSPSRAAPPPNRSLRADRGRSEFRTP